MRTYYFLLCLLNYAAVVADRFYIIDVGQGNCQLAIYDDEKIGVLYDYGSSSLQKSVKLIQQVGKKLIYQKNQKISEDDIIIEDVSLFKMDDRYQIDESISSQSITNSVCDPMEIENLNSDNFLAPLNHLFIVLSHPDKDHINLINEENIPDKLPITVFCEGDWFGQTNKNGKGLTQDVCNVLKFLKSRKNTLIEFPFYWNGLQCMNKVVPYDKIVEEFEKDTTENFEDIFKLCKSGTILSLMDFYNMHDFLITRRAIQLKHFSIFNSIFDLDDYSYVNTPLFNILKNIKIAHINFPFKDVNSQSAIVEIKMPKLKMQFFLTGDASEETFALIAGTHKDFFKKEEGYTSLVMLPHHGSIENKSIHMLQLFQPDVFGISAGNGGNFNHPSRCLINELNFNSHFFDKFQSTLFKNYLISFKDKKSFLHKVSDESIPFLCTNYLSTIEVNNEGFYGSFSNVIEQDEKIYTIDFSKRVENIEPDNDQKTGLVKKAGECYFCVKIENKKQTYIFYNVVEVSQ